MKYQPNKWRDLESNAEGKKYISVGIHGSLCSQLKMPELKQGNSQVFKFMFHKTGIGNKKISRSINIK